MQVWNMLNTARWKYRTQNIAKNSPFGHRCTTLSGYIFLTKAHIDNREKLIKQQYLPPYVLIIWWLRSVRLFGAPQRISTWFHVLASLLQRRRSTEANQTLHDVWSYPVLVDYMNIFVTEFRNGIFPGSKFTLRPSLALCFRPTARHSSSGRQPNFAGLSRGRHLYSAGRPSRWALAHILVLLCFVVAALESRDRQVNMLFFKHLSRYLFAS